MNHRFIRRPARRFHSRAMYLTNFSAAMIFCFVTNEMHNSPCFAADAINANNSDHTTSALATSTTNRVPHLLAELNDPKSHTVLVAAHRAGWMYAPENSLKGIDICIAMGVDILEIDLHRTKDGHFILMHDKTLDRTTNGKGKVSDWTLEDLRELRLKDREGHLTDEHIPTLEELMEHSRGKILVYLDKTEDCIDVVHEQLVKMHATENAVFYGSRTTEEMRKRYGELVDDITYLPKIDDNTANAEEYLHAFSSLPHTPVYVIEFKTMDSPTLREIPDMAAQSKRVWASPLLPEYTAGLTDVNALNNPDAVWGWMIQHGVNMFCTDQPKALLQYLRSKGLHE